MANEPAVTGATVIVGFAAGTAVANVIRDSHDTETTADIEYVRDENNNEATAVVSNLGARVTVAGVCSAAVTIKKGDVVTINSVGYLVESATERRTKTVCRFELTAYKPAAATWGGGS